MTEKDKLLLIEVKTKLPLETYMKVAEETAVKNCKRGKLFENALNEYFDMEQYALDRAELQGLIGSKNHCDRVRIEELKRRIEVYETRIEEKYGIQFRDVLEVF